MTIPLETPPPAPPLPPRTSERFFLWVSGLGVARSDGWLGGVAAGIAARLRIDPLIVRGILVIAAIVGLPAIFLYAVAWALLPDAEGRIHARDLVHRTYQSAQLGILAVSIIGLVPAAPLTGQLFGFGYLNWSAFAVLSWVVGALLTTALIFMIVRAARRAPDADASARSTAAAVLPQEEVPAPENEPEHVQSMSAPAPPAPLPQGVDDPDALAAWREQHAAWKQQDQLWRREQQYAERAAKEQLRRERQATAAQFSAEAAERRRIRRASKPRANAAYVASAAGLALIAGSLIGLTADPSIAIALGLFVAGFVLACAMIIAGVARRRSGILAFLTVAVSMIGGIVAVPSALGAALVAANYGVTNYETTEVRQLFGNLQVTLFPLPDGASHLVTVDKSTGYTEIYVEPGVTLELTATVNDDVSVHWQRSTMLADGSTEYVDDGTWTPATEADGHSVLTQSVTSPPMPGDEETPLTVAPVSIDQRTGVIQIYYYESSEENAR